jgi:transcriptional regulator with XRE-family HTH domain
VVGQAAFHGVDKSLMYRYRSGETAPGLGVALSIAADLGVRVESLFSIADAADNESRAA